MSKIIGLICEDRSDFQIFDEIFKKYVKPHNYKVKKFVANGCGKILSKCEAWIKDLCMNGCEYIIVAQDLDKNNLSKLRQELENKICRSTRKPSVVVIPTKEIEAWLLTDPKVLQSVFNLNRIPRVRNNPETIVDPKKEIDKLVQRHRTNNNVFYVHTTHNLKLIEKIKLPELRKCKSFLVLDNFMKNEFKRKKSK